MPFKIIQAHWRWFQYKLDDESDAIGDNSNESKSDETDNYDNSTSTTHQTELDETLMLSLDESWDKVGKPWVTGTVTTRSVIYFMTEDGRTSRILVTPSTSYLLFP